MLRVDLHMHTGFSPDSEMSPERLVARCLEVGLTCVAVTDHNSLEGARAVEALAPFTVIVGEEIRSADGEIAGLFLKERVPPGLTAVETAARIKDQGGLVSVPHPFDRFRRGVISRDALDLLVPYVDIVEGFNSRNTMHGDNRRATEFARTHGLVVSAVSDAHLPFELGRTYVEIPGFDGTPAGFLDELSRGSIVVNKTSPLVHAATTLTKLKRRFLVSTSSSGGRRPGLS